MLQIIEQTKEEKVAMYMKLPKKQIVEMLINCNDIITALPIDIHMLSCDGCGCHPNTIYNTKNGSFCERCNSVQPNK